MEYTICLEISNKLERELKMIAALYGKENGRDFLQFLINIALKEGIDPFVDRFRDSDNIVRLLPAYYQAEYVGSPALTIGNADVIRECVVVREEKMRDVISHYKIFSLYDKKFYSIPCNHLILSKERRTVYERPYL